MELLFVTPIFAIAFLFVIATAIWVFIDASNLGVKKGILKGFLDLSPGEWAAGCILFWIIVFPTYLSKREEFVELAKKRNTDNPTAPRPGPTSSLPDSPPPPPTTFYVYLQDQVKGPFSREQLKALLAVATVNEDTPCCQKGSEDWQTIAAFIDARKSA